MKILSAGTPGSKLDGLPEFAHGGLTLSAVGSGSTVLLPSERWEDQQGSRMM